jgi:hypothetical protein
VGLPLALTPSRSRQPVNALVRPLREHGFAPMRLRHDPYGEWLDGVSDALAYRLRGFGTRGPFATAAARPRLRLPVPGGQRELAT